MHQQWIIIFLLAYIYVHISHQISSSDSTHYIAAVAKYNPIYDENNVEITLMANINAYVKHIELAKRQNADIIVFPEYGLTSIDYILRQDYINKENWVIPTVIPPPEEHHNPCRNVMDYRMWKLSCAAQLNKIYVVINIIEKSWCTIKDLCPKNKVLYYNTNVVFDRDGTIIAKYRKSHLSPWEAQLDISEAAPEAVTFHTDFGVQFGMFTCHDILFYKPALQLTRINNVTDIVYPAAWFFETPFLSAVQVQAGWSFEEDVNLLVSNYNKNNTNSTDDGIYFGREGRGEGTLFSGRRETILISKVPKKNKNKCKSCDCIGDDCIDIISYDEQYEHISNSYTHILKTSGTYNLNICRDDFCCNLKVNVMKENSCAKSHQFAIYNNTHFPDIKGGILACGIILCSSNNSTSDSMHKSETIFSDIKITATFKNYKNVLIIPSTLNSDLLPLSHWTYKQHVHGNDVTVTMSLNSTKHLVTFGLYSRNFFAD